MIYQYTKKDVAESFYSCSIFFVERMIMILNCHSHRFLVPDMADMVLAAPAYKDMVEFQDLVLK